MELVESGSPRESDSEEGNHSFLPILASLFSSVPFKLSLSVCVCVKLASLVSYILAQSLKARISGVRGSSQHRVLII